MFTGLLMAFTAFFMLTAMGSVAQAGPGHVLLGFRYCDQAKNDDIGLSEITNFYDVTEFTFTTYFKEYSSDADKLTITGNNGDIQIGAIWTNEAEYDGQWAQIRVVIDSDGDSAYSPFDWSDESHPWNRPDNNTPNNSDDDPTSWTYTYPDDYPETDKRGQTITITWNTEGGYVEDFPWDTFQWWWYESQGGFDKTMIWWMEQGNLMVVWWGGRDVNWNVLPNGDYGVQVWVDENDNGAFEDSAPSEAREEGVVAISTVSITGTVKDSDGSPIVGAEVDAGSYKAWGQARTKSDGTFVISGIEADEKSSISYHVRVQATGKVTKELDVTMPANATTVAIDGDPDKEGVNPIVLSDAIAITGTITLPEAFASFENQWGWEQNDLWVWVDAWNKQGPGWGNINVRFEVGDLSKEFTINIPPSGSTTYEVSFHVEGYAVDTDTSASTQVKVTSDGAAAGTFYLKKAAVVTGSVKLSEAVSEWKHIDVQAVKTDDTSVRYWGWGCIEGSDESPASTGNFRLDGVPAGTYDIQIRVWGFAAKTLEAQTIGTENTDLGTVSISMGNKISGILTVEGDTADLKRWQGDTEDPMSIWVDAWSPTAGWGGTSVRIARGENKTANYNIGGLGDGTYEIHCWIGEGYELSDADGNSPVFATISGGNAEKNIKLVAFSGSITGTITGDGVTVDLSKVVVEAKRPWDWLPPQIATVANGGISGSTYTIEGLGTGDYVLKVGMYDGWTNMSGEYAAGIDNYDGQGWLKANTSAGVVMERLFIQNGQSTTKNVALEAGYSISGTISLSETDVPWHDFGDGTFDGEGKPGSANGAKDTDIDSSKSEVISLAQDLVNQSVRAMPMAMMFMGGSDPRMGTIQESDGTYRYQIDGLAPGVYIIQAPFNSQRISDFETGGPGEDINYFGGGENTHHWSVENQTVVISGDNVGDVNFTLSNGYTVTGTLTLPEAQTTTSEEDWDQWRWVGHLELETPGKGFLGHGKSLFKKDFEDGSRYDFTFNHVTNGDYLVRFWTDLYVPGGAKFTVNNGNTSVNLTIEKGANLVGKLVDADTGEAITSEDGVRVTCEAYPWVEGSWRETRDDEWSSSYIENDSGLQSGDTGGTEGKRENKTPGKFHLTALPASHKYVVMIETACGGNKTGGAKNYVGRVIAGIDIPEGATGDIDVGTIKLSEGTTIKGRLIDADGVAIAGVEVCAIPSDPHSGSAEAIGTSDTNGYYTVYGIDPDVDYYDLIAAERPFLFEDWGKKIEWGQKFMYNVAPKTEDANFTLGATTASLSGTINIPESSEFMLPFKGEGHEFPVAYIILQKKGVVYKDVLEGIEGMTTPTPSETYQASYTIDNIEPGAYKVLIMNYGLPTFAGEKVIVAGSNTLNYTWASAGYKISGSCALETGGYPSAADISGVICMNTSDRSLTFGQLTEEADGTYSAYEVPGLATGSEYQLAFYRESGFDDMPDVMTSGDVFKVESVDISSDATITRDPVPILMIQAIKDADDANTINIGIFSTTYLVDKSIGVVETEPTADSTAGELYIKAGAGTLGTIVLSGDKRNISFSYTKAEGDGDVTLTLAVHYGSDADTKLADLTFNVNSAAKNGDVVSVYTAGQVKLGNGDGSQIYIPAGAMESSDKGKVDVTIEKSTESPGALGGASINVAADMGAFAGAVVAALPSGITAVGDQYDFTAKEVGTDLEPEYKDKMTVQIEYDPDSVSDTSLLNVYHYVSGAWTKEATSRTLDTDNKTISVEVTSLSPFVAGEGEETTTTTTTTGAGSSSDCFIGAAASGFPTGWSLAGLMFLIGVSFMAVVRTAVKKT